MSDRHRPHSHHDRNEPIHVSKHDSRHHKSRRKRDHSEEAREGRGVSNHSNHVRVSSVIQKATSADLMKNDYFVIDRNGDSGILQYGSNHSYQVPSYRRIGYGLVLGLSRFLRIDRQHTTDKEIQLVSWDSRGARRDKAIFGRVARLEEYRIRSTSVDSVIERHENYLAFKSWGSNESKEEKDDSSQDESAGYRSIKGKAKVKDMIDKDLELNQPKLGLASQGDLDIISRLMRIVEIEPDNGQAWLDLIKQKYPNSVGGQTFAERISAADIKISMYEKALKHVTDSLMTTLLGGLLEEAALVWDQNKIQRKWKEVLRDNKHSVDLWIGYLNYLQTYPIRFKFDDLKDAYTDCFRILKETILDLNILLEQRYSESAARERNIVATQLVYLLLRFTICLREGAYTEQAIAIWQINLKYHFASKRPSPQELESFWESEVARTGESNAYGLDHHQIHNNGDAIEIDNSSGPRKRLSSMSIWLAHEVEMSVCLPARTMDVIEDEDAFRVVFFSDIQPFVPGLPREISETLLDALLLFCGLPSLWQTETKSWSNDLFIYHGGLDRSYESRELIPSENPVDWAQSSWAKSSYQMTTDTLFAQASPFPCSKLEGSVEGKPTIPCPLPIPLTWIHNVLKDLIERGSSIDRIKLMGYLLAFELQYFPREVKKSSKKLLKANPQSLQLYNIHALIEYRTGNHIAAEKVLETAIKMRPDDPYVTSLKRTLVWESLENYQASSALKCFVQEPNEVAIFKAQQNLLAERDKAVSNNIEDCLFLSHINCLILLSYLTNPNPIEAALAIFDSSLLFLSSKLSSEDACLEVLHQDMSRLLQHHMSNHQYKPSLIRKIVQKSLSAYPTNTIFLSLFQRNEQRFRINDRVRSVVHEILHSTRDNTSSPLIGHLFAIHSELSRSTHLGSSTASIRSAFERAIDDPLTKHSPSVWSMYITFERSMTNLPPTVETNGKLKQVLLRAITACPWYRDFYLSTFKILTKVGNLIEARGIYDLLVDREIRVHVSLKIEEEAEEV